MSESRLSEIMNGRRAPNLDFICTYGLDKKTQTPPPQEIKKAEQLKKLHFGT